MNIIYIIGKGIFFSMIAYENDTFDGKISR